jgi:hypothetical protein
LRSKNWEAEYDITYTKNGETVTEFKLTLDAVNAKREEYSDVKIIKTNTINGTYINLDDGKIGANNFSLEAGSVDANQLILSSDPPRFYMQLDNGNKVSTPLIDIDPTHKENNAIKPVFYLQSANYSSEDPNAKTHSVQNVIGYGMIR